MKSVYSIVCLMLLIFAVSPSWACSMTLEGWQSYTLQSLFSNAKVRAKIHQLGGLEQLGQITIGHETVWFAVQKCAFSVKPITQNDPQFGCSRIVDAEVLQTLCQ